MIKKILDFSIKSENSVCCCWHRIYAFLPNIDLSIWKARLFRTEFSMCIVWIVLSEIHIDRWTSRYWITYISLSIANWQNDSQYRRWFNGYVWIWMRSYSLSSNFTLRSVSNHRIQSNRQLFAIVKVICIIYVYGSIESAIVTRTSIENSIYVYVRNRYARITSIAIAIAIPIAFEHFSLELWTENRSSNLKDEYQYKMSHDFDTDMKNEINSYIVEAHVCVQYTVAVCVYMQNILRKVSYYEFIGI